MTGMTQLHDITDSFTQRLDEVMEELVSTRREFSGRMMMEYPNRRHLDREARGVRRTLKAHTVQFNAIGNLEQRTIGSCPTQPVEPIPVENSLCVMTVSHGVPMAVDDIATDPITRNHSCHGEWASWASVPLFINGVPAGTLCALEKERARRWTVADQLVLERSANRVSDRIQRWLST